VRNKTDFIKDYIMDTDTDLMALTESWVTNLDSDMYFINELTPPGYVFKHVPRDSNTQGGGVALLFKATLDITMVTVTPTQSFEYMEALLKISSKSIRIVIVYRPPPSQANGLKMSTFIEEFSEFLQRYTLSGGDLILMGDFNFHVDDQKDRNATAFMDIIQSSNLKQHVTEATHKHGHTLDLILTRDELPMPPVENIMVSDCTPSDHYMVSFNLSAAKPPKQMKTIKYRKLKTLDIEKFKDDLKASDLISNPSTSLDGLVDQYNNTLKAVLDKHAPETEKTVVIRPNTPWCTEDIRHEKQNRRKLERKWRRSRAVEDRKAYKAKCCYINKLVSEAKKTILFRFSGKM
jgi:exonuclease III